MLPIKIIVRAVVLVLGLATIWIQILMVASFMQPPSPPSFVLAPAFRLVIGIPHCPRPGEVFYLGDTMASLLNITHTPTPIVFVIYVTHGAALPVALVAKWQSSVHRVEIVFAPATPSKLLHDFKHNPYHDTPERVRWRSRQNLDYAGMMKHAVDRYPTAYYFLLLEDDVSSKSTRYLQDIWDYASQPNRSYWAMLMCSSIGGIGRLFPFELLREAADFLELLYETQPIDLLINHWAVIRQLHPARPELELFTHRGRVSTLPGQIRA